MGTLLVATRARELLSGTLFLQACDGVLVGISCQVIPEKTFKVIEN